MHWTQSSHFRGTDDFDVILMIHLLCLLPTQGYDLWKDVLYSAKAPDTKLDLETL